MTPNTLVLFCDVETTGIDGPHSDPLLEVALVLTQGPKFDVLAERSWLTLPAGTSVAEARAIAASKRERGDFDVEAMHEKSGLWADLESADRILTYDEVDEAIEEFLAAEVGDATGLLLGGNSQGFDRGYISAHLPSLDARLSYRNLDGTSVAYANSGLGVAVSADRTGVTAHRGIADLHLCIADMLAQREAVLLAVGQSRLSLSFDSRDGVIFAPDSASDIEWAAALVRINAVADAHGFDVYTGHSTESRSAVVVVDPRTTLDPRDYADELRMDITQRSAE